MPRTGSGSSGSGSLWFAEGDYEPIADNLFNHAKVDGFFLEYDDERSGGFEPLRFVPKAEMEAEGYGAYLGQVS